MGSRPIILLDTHVWVWHLMDPEQLSKKAHDAIRTAQSLLVSVISCWEVAVLVSKQKLLLSTEVEEWVHLSLEEDRVQLVDMTPKIAVLSSRLPGNIHGDPADRIIAATAMQCSCPLITKDEKLIQYPHVETIW